MKPETLEKMFKEGLKVYAIDNHKTALTTGRIQELNRRDGMLEAKLYPYVSFRTAKGFLSGHRLQGPIDKIMTIEIQENPLYGTRYDIFTLNYDTHKRQADKIVMQELERMMQSKKEKYSRNYQSYLRIAMKIA